MGIVGPSGGGCKGTKVTWENVHALGSRARMM